MNPVYRNSDIGRRKNNGCIKQKTRRGNRRRVILCDRIKSNKSNLIKNTDVKTSVFYLVETRGIEPLTS